MNVPAIFYGRGKRKGEALSEERLPFILLGRISDFPEGALGERADFAFHAQAAVAYLGEIEAGDGHPGEHTGQDDVENGGREEQRTRGHADDLRAADAADEGHGPGQRGHAVEGVRKPRLGEALAGEVVGIDGHARRGDDEVRPGVKRIVGLTGTPSSNGLMDLWAEFRILDMGKRLGRFITHYRNTFFRSDKRNGQVVFSYKPLPGAEEQIYDAISDITISMKAVDHLDMPECVHNDAIVTLSETERKAYVAM